MGLAASSSLARGGQEAPSTASYALGPGEAVIPLESTPWWLVLEEAVSELQGREVRKGTLGH